MANASTDRDLIGYGRTPPQVAWPDGAVLAVSLVVTFEEGCELSVTDGDPVNQGATGPGKALPDRALDHQFAYGARVGIWRVLEALATYRRPATFYVCGRALERLPEIGRALIAAGHEPACHGWRWQAHADYPDIDAERRDIRRCIDATRAICGEPPRGFFCRGNESPWTRTLLRDMGFDYCSNAFDDDLPYWDKGGGKPLLVVPYSLDTNDMRFARPGGFVVARDFADYVGDAIHSLVREGEAGTPRMLSIGLHLRTIGLPGRIRALHDILAGLEAYGPRVWVARRIDIARFWAGRFPAPRPQSGHNPAL